jgi:hypothetical protein
MDHHAPPRRSTKAVASGTKNVMFGSTASQIRVSLWAKSARSVEIGFLFLAAGDKQRHPTISLQVAELTGGARSDKKMGCQII